MRFIFVFVFLSFLLIGCASLSPEYVNSLPEETSILIISAVGNTLDVREYTTLWGSKLLDSLDVEYWELNKTLENYIWNTLKNPRFKFYTYHQLSNEKIKVVHKRWNDEIDINDLKSQLIKISDRYNIDKILVLSEEHIEWHNAMLAGYGIYRYKSLLNFGKTVDGLAYTCIKLKWYDAKTFESKHVRAYYHIAGLGPENIDRIYDNEDWSIFRNFKNEYIELFKNCLDNIVKKSALSIMQ